MGPSSEAVEAAAKVRLNAATDALLETHPSWFKPLTLITKRKAYATRCSAEVIAAAVLRAADGVSR
jgi:hypothetical protein